MRFAGPTFCLFLLPVIAGQNSTTPSQPVARITCPVPTDESVSLTNLGTFCEMDTDCAWPDSVCCDYNSLGQNTCVLYETGQDQSPDGPPPTPPQPSLTSTGTFASSEIYATITLPVVTSSAQITLPVIVTTLPATTFGLPMQAPPTTSIALPTVTQVPNSPNNQDGSSIPGGGNGAGPSSQTSPAKSPPAVATTRAAGQSSAATTRIAGAQNGVTVIPATVETLVRTAGGVTFTSVSGGTPTTITAADGRVTTSTLGGTTSISVSGGTLTTAIVTRSARTIARISSTATQVSGGYKVVAKVSGGTIVLTVIPLLAGLAAFACV